MVPQKHTHSWLRLSSMLLLILGAGYALLAYMIMPRFWRRHTHYPSISTSPTTTFDADHLPGDPLNIGIVGTQEALIQAFRMAGWQPAAPITVRSGLGIIESVLFQTPDRTAPMSKLYLWGRVQDLAFEQEVGRSARQRHHVRLWKAPGLVEGRPLWLGAVTFDIGVELSHTTGQVTHRIAPNVDSERDRLMAALQKTGLVQEIFQTQGLGPVLHGRNAGGDWYYTDGKRTIAVLRS